ncbi:hypothetical protein [Yinghuangia seranimata]|uniref:hypothetical protein n=1 Tax=Yinghuangia seranimata TaxID=408067 RepID=UPI00248BAF7C|nr:hypothetical protein [Yinghuangia seranimata]MDI2127873.1 hypothetical protein [Yinghuangia seranimata]
MTAMNEDPGRDGQVPDDLSEEVRRRLHEAVSGIRPAPDALERLREAVPARRRRRRATALTAAATVVVLAIATPMVRTVVLTDQNSTGSESNPAANVDGSGDPSDPNGATAKATGRSSSVGSTVGGAGGGGHSTSGPGQATVSPTALPTAGTLPTSLAPLAPSGGATTATGTVAPTGAPTALAPPPACGVTDLEQGLATGLEPGGPGADGLTYGTVAIRNASKRDCSISGPGIVLVAAPPGNAPVQVSVKMHVTGDPAMKLPDIPPSTGPLVVRPGATYEFKFAWAPTLGTGKDGSCTPGDNPAGPPPPVPSLAYMLADGGVKLAQVTLSAACGGMVYRTDVYPTAG